MPDLDGKKNNFITREVTTAENLINAVNEFDALRREWDAQGYSASITDEDIQGDNAHVSAAQLAAGFTTLEALKAVLAAGHWTNLYNLKK